MIRRLQDDDSDEESKPGSSSDKKRRLPPSSILTDVCVPDAYVFGVLFIIDRGNVIFLCLQACCN